MGSKQKTESNQTTTTTSTPIENQDTRNYRASIEQGSDALGAIDQVYGKAERDIGEMANVDEMPEGEHERRKSEQLFNLNVEKGNARSNAALQDHMYRTSSLGNLAGMTMGQTTTGNSSGTQIVRSNPGVMGVMTPILGGTSSVLSAKAGR